MNAADRALAAGFAALTATAGDAVTFRGSSLSAVVNWVPFDEKPAAPGLPDFNERETSRIQFPMTAVATVPRVGEYVTTEGGVIHRIQSVAGNGSEWVLNCEVQR